MNKLAPAVLLALPLTLVGGTAFAADTAILNTETAASSSVVLKANPASEKTAEKADKKAEKDADKEEKKDAKAEEKAAKDAAKAEKKANKKGDKVVDAGPAYVTLSFVNAKTGETIKFAEGQSPTLYIQEDGKDDLVVVNDTDGNGIYGDEAENKILPSADTKITVALADGDVAKLVGYTVGKSTVKEPLLLDEILTVDFESLPGGENKVTVYVELPEDTTTVTVPEEQIVAQDEKSIATFTARTAPVEAVKAEKVEAPVKAEAPVEAEAPAEAEKTVEEPVVTTAQVHAAAYGASAALPAQVVVPQADDTKVYGLQVENDTPLDAALEPVDTAEDTASNLEGRNIKLERENGAALDAAEPTDGMTDDEEGQVITGDEIGQDVEVISDDELDADAILVDEPELVAAPKDSLAETGATAGILGLGGLMTFGGAALLALRGKKKADQVS